MRKKVADKNEVRAFLTSVLRNEEADVKDRLKVSECLLRLCDETGGDSGGKVNVSIRVVE